jgi:hypothetical protein
MSGDSDQATTPWLEPSEPDKSIEKRGGQITDPNAPPIEVITEIPEPPPPPPPQPGSGAGEG